MPIGKRDPARVTIRRLNRAEYNNTIRDLTGVDVRLLEVRPRKLRVVDEPLAGLSQGERQTVRALLGTIPRDVDTDEDYRAVTGEAAGELGVRHHGQRADQRVPQSSLRIAENTSSETVREFWHGTRPRAARSRR